MVRQGLSAGTLNGDYNRFLNATDDFPVPHWLGGSESLDLWQAAAALARHPRFIPTWPAAPQAKGDEVLHPRPPKIMHDPINRDGAGSTQARQTPGAPGPTPILERTTFETSRLLEFFTESELQMQIGHTQENAARSVGAHASGNAAVRVNPVPILASSCYKATPSSRHDRQHESRECPCARKIGEDRAVNEGFRCSPLARSGPRRASSSGWWTGYAPLAARRSRWSPRASTGGRCTAPRGRAGAPGRYARPRPKRAMGVPRDGDLDRRIAGRAPSNG
jgi:hypothetical protein